MSFFEGIRHLTNNTAPELEKKLTSLLRSFQDSAISIIRSAGIPESKAPFLKPCNICIYIDEKSLYIIGTNINVSFTQKVVYHESDVTATGMDGVKQAAQRDLGFEEPFGILISRSDFEAMNDANQARMAKEIMDKYLFEIIRRVNNTVKISPIFTKTEIEIDDKLVFCLSPFTERFDAIFKDHISGIVNLISSDFRCVRANDIYDNQPIIEDIWENICSAKIIISDLTGKNPNVFYETGIAHTVGKEVILISQTIDDVPFDLRHLRCIIYNYDPRGMREFEGILHATILKILSR